MIVLLLTIITTYLFGTFIGHIVHWSLHQRWSKIFYKTHMAHHVTMYPKTDLLSQTYRTAGLESGWLWFGIPIAAIFTPSMYSLWLLGVPFWCLGVATVEAVLIGWLHGYVHDSFHLIGHPFENFRYFPRLRELHFKHHFNMQTNFGIFSFIWDRIFGTFKEPGTQDPN